MLYRGGERGNFWYFKIAGLDLDFSPKCGCNALGVAGDHTKPTRKGAYSRSGPTVLYGCWRVRFVDFVTIFSYPTPFKDF